MLCASRMPWRSLRLPRTFESWAWLTLNLLAWSLMAIMVAQVVAPIFHQMETLGGHDWDQMATHRYFMIKAIRSYHQLPFWNPYGCGGHPEWASTEGATALASPALLLYLLAKLPVALRTEIAATAALSAIGTWLWAGRFTRSPGLRLFVCAVFAVNGRWALQATAGHTWHLYYLWVPWAFYFYERARTTASVTVRGAPVAPATLPLSARRRNIVYLGACIAMMVYTGAIYPLPQTVFLLGIYSVLLAIVTRRLEPIRVAILGGVWGVILAGPKLFPILDTMRKYPRLIDSTETMDVAAFFTLLTARNQDFGARLANVSQWGWHEWGMYIGWAPVLVIGWALLRSRNKTDVPLKWAGLTSLVLSFGAFHPQAPWSLLHDLPIFKSQHVPSRWLYPAVLFLALLAALNIERWLRRIPKKRLLAELVLVAAAGWVALDVAHEAKIPMARGFWMKMPQVAAQTTGFYQEVKAPPALRYLVDDYAPPGLPATIVNVGVIESVSFAGLNPWAPRDENGRIRGLGARGRGESEYRGEVFTASGNGAATFVEWSPNRVTVQVDGATPGDLVVMNQNFDEGWRANGEAAVNHSNTIAARIVSPRQLVTFRYVPRYVPTGIVVFALGVLAALLWPRWPLLPFGLDRFRRTSAARSSSRAGEVDSVATRADDHHLGAEQEPAELGFEPT